MTTAITTISGIPEEAKDFITQAYLALSNQSGFVSREGQHLLSELVCESLLTKKPLAAEAPTGTGKTLAYLIGLLAAKKVNNEPEPVVVATATKALQGQLMQSDLPKLIAAGLVFQDDFVLAKGKSNYLCLRDAKEVERQGADIFDEGDETDLPDTSHNVPVADVSKMLSAYKAKIWDGDFDSYMGTKPESLFRIQVKGETCTNRKCEFSDNCAYLKARKQLGDAKGIIANHDLVLADLQLSASMGDSLFPAKTYMLVVDEAHNFPHKAIAVGQRELNVVDALNKVFKLRNIPGMLSRHPELAGYLLNPARSAPLFEARELIEALQELMEILNAIEVDDTTGQIRFPKGTVPDVLMQACEKTVKVLPPVIFTIESLRATILEGSQVLSPAALKSQSDVMYTMVSASKAIALTLETLLAFTGESPVVRWIAKTNDRVCIHTSPINGADVLRPLLWDASRATPLFVSATLRDVKGFGNFKRNCGLPASARLEVLPYIFPYEQSTLTIPAMSATPKLHERVAFLTELRTKLPKAIQPTQATLVLVPSRVMLREVAPMLRTRFGSDAVLVQGDMAIKPLLATHQQRVAKKLPSILVGMVTMAEGLDLPGNLCEHVVILALPFSVPTDPVEQEIAEVLGQKYFGERSLPEAMTRLLQMTGRLLRRESDRGNITVFDRRLVSTGYGREMLAALPPFKKVIEPMTR